MYFISRKYSCLREQFELHSKIRCSIYPTTKICLGFCFIFHFDHERKNFSYRMHGSTEQHLILAHEIINPGETVWGRERISLTPSFLSFCLCYPSLSLATESWIIYFAVCTVCIRDFPAWFRQHRNRLEILQSVWTNFDTAGHLSRL